MAQFSEPSMTNSPKSKPAAPGQAASTPNLVPPTSMNDAKAEAAEVLAAPAFPIVGIGASAGGLVAFQAFFSGLPANADPGMAFVLVQHLAPDHKSLLAELIARCTRMPVFEVQDGMRVQINCVYVIPPNCEMTLQQGALHLHAPVVPRGKRLPINGFFQSLALDLQAHAIAIVLSGTGSDGTLGVRAIKEAGGMVMAQDPPSCEYDGMPRNAIATGLVDYQLPPADMLAQLIACVAHSASLSLNPGRRAKSRLKSVLGQIFALLHSQTGRDFSNYKASGVQRRIAKRMALQQIETPELYVNYLRDSATERQALFHDLLIGVTRFFRDPKAFEVLENQVIPKLLANKPADGVVRVWCAACSTGEEAYSLAMVLQEQMERLNLSRTVQVFATDIDNRAIARARTGLFPAGIAANLSPQRLARFFVPEPAKAGYRVCKSLRDLLVFSEQDVVKDPPFSRLDLISCRNLLIYLDAHLQKKLFALFHYVLNPQGCLFLGGSERVGDFAASFATIDHHARLYQRQDDQSGARYGAARRSRVLAAAVDATLAGLSDLQRPALPVKPVKPLLRELVEQMLLQQLAPASALVNAAGDIFYLHGRTGLYLEPSAGEVRTQNLLKMARPGLRHRLGNALHQAIASGQTVQVTTVRVKTNGHDAYVNLSVRPAPIVAGAEDEEDAQRAAPLYLVTLEDAPQPVDALTAPTDVAPGFEGATQARCAVLTQELLAKDEYLQSVHAELESANEELMSSNEQLLSVNEELQTSYEEMETAKEQLQSFNAELHAVNTRLLTRVAEITHANNDMNKMLLGTGIGTVFVDLQLNILRFTPEASRITNLIASDVGRPVAHIAFNLLGYNSLVADLQAVLGTLIPKEAEVHAPDGQWYTLHIRPYRTLANEVEGAVISFVNITEVVRMREVLRQANHQQSLAAVVVRDTHDAVTLQGLDGRTLAWNPGAVRLYGWSEQEALNMNVRERIPEGLRPGALARLTQLGRSEALQAYHTQRLTRSGAVLQVSIVPTVLINEAGQVYAIATTERALPEDSA